MNGDHDHHAGQCDRRPSEVRYGAHLRPADGPYRLSDLERDRAIAALGDAYAEGRLDQDEFEVRLEAASRAVLGSDLDPLFADLPQSRTVVAPVPSAPRRPVLAPASGRHRPPFAAMLFLLALAAVTHAWLLIPLAFVIAGHRRRRWAPGAAACSRR